RPRSRTHCNPRDWFRERRADRPPRPQRGRNELMSTAAETIAEPGRAAVPGRGRKQLSEGARAERRLGWLLCAPAVLVMLAVTAYPIGYAIYLSLQRYILSAPQLQKFVGFSNYAAVLSSPFWWHALWVTVVIVVVS